MEFRFNLRPTHVSGFDICGRGRTKFQVLSIIRSATRSWSFSKWHDGVFLDSETVRVYTVEKRRKKVEVLAKPKKWSKKRLRDNGFDANEEKYDTRVVTKRAHWVGHYYDIPLAWLKVMNMKTVQGARTWKMVPIA